MSESEREPDGISDDDLPEDLKPGEDNPLAEPLDEDEVETDLDMQGGKTANESEDSEEDDAEEDGDDEEE